MEKTPEKGRVLYLDFKNKGGLSQDLLDKISDVLIGETHQDALSVLGAVTNGVLAHIAHEAGSKTSRFVTQSFVNTLLSSHEHWLKENLNDS